MRTEIRTNQIEDGGVTRDDLNTADTGKAVVRKIIQGTGISISSTGVDSGTGDVEINATGGGVTNSAGANVVPKSDGTNLVASHIHDQLLSFPYVNISVPDGDVVLGDVDNLGPNKQYIDIVNNPASLTPVITLQSNHKINIGDRDGLGNSTLVEVNDAASTVSATASTESLAIDGTAHTIDLNAASSVRVNGLPIRSGAIILNTSEALAASDLVNIWSDSGTPKVRLADASVNRQADGFVLEAVDLGDPAIVYSEGTNDQLSGMTIGAEQWLSSIVPGGLQSAPPIESGELVQRVGKSFSATVLNFQKGDVFKRRSSVTAYVLNDDNSLVFNDEGFAVHVGA